MPVVGLPKTVVPVVRSIITVDMSDTPFKRAEPQWIDSVPGGRGRLEEMRGPPGCDASFRDSLTRQRLEHPQKISQIIMFQIVQVNPIFRENGKKWAEFT